MRTRERIDPSQLDIKDNVVSINRVDRGWYAGTFSGGVRVRGSQQLVQR